MPNRVATFNTFAGSAPPWSLPNLDANFSSIATAFNDASLGYNNYIGVDTGGANNYVVSCTFGAPTTYNVGMTLTFKPALSNTGASTIAVNSLGTAPIQHGDGTACIGGEIQAGKNVTLIYNGTAFQIQGPPFGYGTSLYYDYDDFVFLPGGAGVGGTSKLFSLVNSGGNGTIITPTGVVTGHPGNIQPACGTIAFKFCGAASSEWLFLDSTTITIRTMIVTPPIIDQNVTMFGLTHSPTTPSTDNSILFIGSSASGFWQMYTANGSAGTSVNTTTALSASTWYDLTIVANAAGATFFVNGTQVGTQAVTYPASNVPMEILIGIAAANIATSRAMNVDLFEITITGIPGLTGSTNPRFTHGLV